MRDTILESDVAERLGVDRALLRRLRDDVLAPSDVERGPRGAVVYTPAGLEKIAAAVGRLAGGVSTPAPVAEVAGLQPGGQGGAVEELAQPARRIVSCVVLRLSRVSTKRMEVRPSDEPAAVCVVHVRDNSNFTVGMEVPCQLRGRVGFVHGRLPRRKGRW